jgi:hypothetical protein
MLPKFRSFVRLIIRSFIRSFIQIIFFLPLCCRNSDRSFVRSFIVPIHRSSFVHTTIHYDYSPLLFIVTIHIHYSSSLLFIITIHHRYYSSMICILTFPSPLFIVTNHRYYSSVIQSSQISTTHPSCCPVHLRPARPMFQSYELR